MLTLEGVQSGYGKVQVLFDLSLVAHPGEIHCLVGRNGAGKTTALKTIMGLLRLQAGRITLDGTDLGALPAHDVPRQGLGYVPQGRRLFPELTVAENIEMGMLPRASGPETRDRVLDLFPRLRERLGQQAHTLSGGEQQMLATARALCLRPEVLLLDEPTEGLQPSMIDAIRDVTLRMRAEGLAVVLVEQRIDTILTLADRVTVLEHGRSVATLDAAALKADPGALNRYLGVS